MIRRAGIEDINKIIKLHLRSFGKNHFSAFFSKTLLEKYFVSLINMNKYCFVFYDADEYELQGYLIAGFNTDQAVSSFTKNNQLQVFFTLLKHPSFILEKITELFTRIFRQPDRRSAKCRLYLIAIEEKFKGKGFGSKITTYLEEELKNDRIDVYGLSVRKDNKSAIDFYNRSGYNIDYENAKSIYYIKNI